jgi:fructose-1,6-bisphosphatase I
VHGFTLDPTIGEFLLSHENIRIPDRGAIYSVNEGNAGGWQDEVRDYVSSRRSSGYSARYIGSLVSDFHRNLLKGGVFLYPGDRKSPEGKLRLVYEANPLGFVVEQAGGAASNGREAILDMVPETLHQRVPLVIGSRLDVAEYDAAMAGASVPQAASGG